MEQYINVDPVKLKQMQAFCWCEFETPIVATPVEFNKIKKKDHMRNGFLMFTRGSIYLFKSKLLQKELKDPVLHHLLDASSFRVTQKEINIQFDDFTLKIKSDNPTAIARPMVYVLKSCTYGLPSLKVMTIEGMYDNIVISQRPENALQWRALFLAHFYNIKGMQLYTMDYFKKYEARQSSMIIIGPSLHPGNFAAAFGHAIAWESQINIVAFQSFAPTKFTMLFDSLVDNAINIKRIAFTDYHNAARIPNFSGGKLNHSSVVQYNFYRCLLPVINSFLEKCKYLPQVEILSIHKIDSINADEFHHLADLAEANNVICNTCRYFEFARTTVLNFPTKRFTTMFNAFERLETVALRYLNGDANRLFKALMNTKTSIRSVHINYMTCKKDLSEIQIPQSLIHLDISFCLFAEESLAQLFKIVTTSQREYPIIFQCINLLLKPRFFELLGQIDLSSCQPNICEFDFSGNQIPNENSLNLFAFLFTQKRLRLLQFNALNLESPVDFLRNMMTLTTNLQLPGFELSGNFDPVTLTQFISALSTMNLTFLRHVGFPNSKAGSQGLGALNALVNSLPNLNEILADGFAPEAPALQAFWQNVVAHKNIVATDLPSEDLRKIGVKKSEMPESVKPTFEAVYATTRVASVGKKDELCFKHLREGENVDFSAEIFLECASVKEYEETDNDFATIELATSKLKSQQEEDKGQFVNEDD